MKYIYLVTSILLSIIAKGQISQGGKPYFLTNSETRYKLAEKLSNCIELSPLNNDSLKLEFQKKSNKKRFYIGILRDINIDFSSETKFTLLKNGDRVWRKEIISPNAKSMSVLFQNFKLAKGCSLFVYTPDFSSILGSFTEKNNKKGGYFSTTKLTSDRVIIELYEPKEVLNKTRFTIKQVSHNFIAINESDVCHNDIKSAKAEWIKTSRSVVKLEVKSNAREYWLCTGTLINDAENSKTPYLLTANHCLADKNTTIEEIKYRFQNMNIIFNYQKGEDFTSITENKSISGAEYRSNSFGLDMALCVLSETPPDNYNPLYAGLNLATASSLNAEERVSIHHPQGDVKKISYSNKALTTYTYSDSEITLDDNAHWVAEWSSGVTESGSSGSALFDSNSRVLGVLTGGSSECDGGGIKSESIDLYSKAGLAWNKYSNETTQLKKWLDPNNKVTGSIESLDPIIKTAIDNGKIKEANDQLDIIQRKKIVNIKLKTKELVSFTLRIYNLMGNLLFQKTFINHSSYENSVDVGQFQKGAYVFQASSKLGTFVTKFYIQ